MTKKQPETQVDFSSFKDEIEALRNELKSMREEKKKFSDAAKQAVEEARDDMITDDEVGSLFIDDKYKEEGFHYRIVDSSRPGRVQSLIKRGYEVVYQSGFKVGDKTVTNSGSLTDAVTVELGTTSSCLGVLMRCPIEHYDKRQKAKARAVRERDAAMYQTAANQSDFGSIQIGDDVFKK
jgi:hypothetical protein